MRLGRRHGDFKQPFVERRKWTLIQTNKRKFVWYSLNFIESFNPDLAYICIGAHIGSKEIACLMFSGTLCMKTLKDMLDKKKRLSAGIQLYNWYLCLKEQIIILL